MPTASDTSLTHEAGSPESVRRLRGRGRLVAAITIPVAAAALVWGGIAATNAFFTSQATVTGQSVGTATVEITADTATSSAPIQVSDLLPGDAESTSIDVANTGTAAVYYSIALPAEDNGDTALEDAIQVTVTVGNVTETRSLTAWQAGYLQIDGALAAGATDTVIVTVALPTGADNTLQGTSAGFSVQITAIQERNTVAPTAGWTAH